MFTLVLWTIHDLLRTYFDRPLQRIRSKLYVRRVDQASRNKNVCLVGQVEWNFSEECMARKLSNVSGVASRLFSWSYLVWTVENDKKDASVAPNIFMRFRLIKWKRRFLKIHQCRHGLSKRAALFRIPQKWRTWHFIQTIFWIAKIFHSIII